jgi:small subunit ribosomal protein S16
MSVKIRLKPTGKRNKRTYRVVVVDESKKRSGSVIEEVGNYNPTIQPEEIKINHERVEYWLKLGAKPTAIVTKLIKKI